MEMKFSRSAGVDFTPMKNESVLFHPQTNQFCLLNSSAAFVWKLLERPHTIRELGDAVCNHFEGVSVTQAVRDVERTLDQLKSLSLVVSPET